MATHGNGIVLTGGKSPDTKWCQRLLTTCDAMFLMSGRLLFHYPDGTKSEGKWLPNLLFAYGQHNVDALRRLPGAGFPGQLMVPA